MSLYHCKTVTGIPLRYDRITELGVPYLNPKWVPKASKEFCSRLQALGHFLQERKYFELAPYPNLVVPPFEILTAGLWVNKPGAHGTGDAMDFDGIWMPNSRRVYLYKKISKKKVVDGYEISSMTRKLTSRLECAISLFFGVVLTEHYNTRHQCHIHFDTTKPEAKWRGTRSQIVILQNALRNIFGEKAVKIDGVIGPITMKAFGQVTGYKKMNDGTWYNFLNLHATDFTA